MVTGDSQVNGANIPEGTARSGGTAASGQKVSTSGSMGPSEAEMVTPACDSTINNKLGRFENHDDHTGSQSGVAKKKKGGQRAPGADKSGCGLRQFSLKVCEKVESKGRTTYNEVADALVADYAKASNPVGTSDQQGQGYDGKNIRRRVYDALNVLMAMDIISKDKKEIRWKGLPRSSLNDMEELKEKQIALRNSIDKKNAHSRELEGQCVGYQNVIQRNLQLYGNDNAPSAGVALPFILIQTRPNATVEVEISEDMQVVHFDFNSTPFELHDDKYVLKQMKCFEKTPFLQLCNTPAYQGEGSNNPSSSNPQLSQPSSSPERYKSQIPATSSPLNSSDPQIPLPNPSMKTPSLSSLGNPQ